MQEMDLVDSTARDLEWFAVRVKSNREKITSLGLFGKGYEVFLPEYRSERPYRTAKQGNPLFPGYLFCRFNVNRRLPVLTLPGVVHIVGLGTKPEPVSEEEIECLRMVVEAGVPLHTEEVYTVGDKVQIERGPLMGVAGVVVGSQPKKLVVSITLLQRSVSVELLPDWVTAAHCAN